MNGPQPVLAVMPAPWPRRDAVLNKLYDLAGWLRYRLLGDMILCRVAPRWLRAAAWRQGFALGLGSGRSGWLLGCLDEAEAGACAAYRYERARLADAPSILLTPAELAAFGGITGWLGGRS